MQIEGLFRREIVVVRGYFAMRTSSYQAEVHQPTQLVGQLETRYTEIVLESVDAPGALEAFPQYLQHR